MGWTERALAGLADIAGKTAISEEDCETVLTGLAAVADALTPAERALVQQHLDICAACREELAALRVAIAPSGAAPTEE